MPWQFTPYMLPLIVTVVVTGGIALYAWNHSQARGAVTLALTCFALLIWSAGYVLELGAVELAGKVFWGKVQYLGIALTPVAWLTFSLQYTRRNEWLSVPMLAFLFIIPLFTQVFIWTTENHGLVWRTFSLDSSGPFPALAVTYGPWFWIHTIFSYLCLLGGSIILFNQARRSRQIYRRQAWLIILSMLGPWVSNALYILRLFPVPNLDVTPFAFALWGIVLAWDIFQFRFLDVVPVARAAVLEGMADGVLVLDARSRIVDANPAARRMLELPEAAVGSLAHEALSHWPELLEHTQRLMDGRAELVRGDVREPSRWYEVQVASLYERPDRVSGRLVVLRDITERKETEKTLALARDQAMEASRLKSQLLAKVSHELRTPLGSIVGYAELAKRGTYGPLPQKHQHANERILASAHYLTKLVNELLDQAQLEAGRMRLNPTPFTPRELTERVCGELSAQAEKRGLLLSTEVEAELPQQLVGDQNRLEQILMNLVANAIKFTRHGSVHVRLYPADADRWAMQVSDTGPGIPPLAQARIFEPFWQMDNSLHGDQAGYGLGLSIVKQLTTLMGGQIHLDSEVGRGSTFTVLLPLQEETA